MKHRSAATCVILLGTILACSCRAADEEKEKLLALLKEIDALVKDGDTAPAVKRIQSQGEPNVVIRHYFVVTSHFYRNRRDIGKMLAFGRATMKYSMDQAAQVKQQDTELARKWKGLAKSMAYNLAVNAWPGWNERGISITRDQSLAALDLARENLKLAVELKRSADVMGNAYWLLGAQHLALEQPADAMEQFKKAVHEFSTGEKDDYRLMAKGYIGIAQLTRAESGEAGKETLKRAIEELAARDTEDARFFNAQLRSVSKVFAAYKAKP